MNWDDVRVYLAVVREGTLRRAAHKLSISQPTAGRRLQALEDALGVALFSRDRSGHRLTEAGQAIRESAEAMEQAAADLTNQSDQAQKLSGGTVRLSIVDWAALFLMKHLPPVEDNDLTIEFVSSERTEGLARHEADIAVRHGLPITGDFLTRKVGQVACAVYGAKDYVQNHPTALTENRYKTCHWVIFTEAQAHYRTMIWLNKRLVPDAPTVRVATTGLVRDAIATGAGLGVLPCFIGDDDPGLQRVGAPITDLPADYWLIVPKDLAGLARVRRAIDWIVGSFEDNRSSLIGDRDG